MKLYLNGAPRYAAEQIMMMLFPADRPECVEQRPDGGDFAEIRVEERENQVLAQTTIWKNGTAHRAEESLPVADCAEDALEKKRRVHQALKVSFYRAALPLLDKPPEWGAMTGVRPAKVAAKLLASGMTRAQADAVLRDTYYVQPRRRTLALAAAEVGRAVGARCGREQVSLYVGIPFCASRCKYCSFVSHSIDKAAHLIEPYLDALEEEMCRVGAAVRAAGLSVMTVYIGGGTPTALTTNQLRRVMRSLREHFDLSGVCEYTVEAGRPDTADAEKLAMIAQEGATRVSVNPQTMDDRILKLMGRRHTAADIVRMVEDIRRIGGLQINMDVIAGLPGDRSAGFADTIRRVLALQPDNVTVHTRAIKKGSSLREARMALPEPAEVAQMVDFAFDAVTAAGLAPYYLYRQKYMSGNLENVGYAKPGCENLYNVLIMEELQSILSLGAGGVTKLVNPAKNQIVRIFNPKYPYEYNNAQSRFAHTAQEIETFYSEF